MRWFDESPERISLNVFKEGVDESRCRVTSCGAASTPPCH